MALGLFLGRLILLLCLYGMAVYAAARVWRGMPAPASPVLNRAVLLALRRGVGTILARDRVWTEGATVSLALPVTFGRSQGNTVQIEDPFVSSCHAEMITDGTAIWLVDRGSRNGTWVGRKRLDRPYRLEKGDEFRLGGTLIRLEE